MKGEERRADDRVALRGPGALGCASGTREPWGRCELQRAQILGAKGGQRLHVASGPCYFPFRGGQKSSLGLTVSMFGTCGPLWGTGMADGARGRVRRAGLAAGSLGVSRGAGWHFAWPLSWQGCLGWSLALPEALMSS